MYLHTVPVAFDLQNDKIVVTWPWGSHAFPRTPEALVEMGEALQNYAIQRSRRERPDHSISQENLIAIRNLVESSPVVAKRYVPGSSGKEEAIPLDKLLEDDDFSMYFDEAPRG